jgi:hypothetical protein
MPSTEVAQPHDRQMPKGGHRRRGNHPEERHHRQFAVPTYVKNRSIAALIDDDRSGLIFAFTQAAQPRNAERVSLVSDDDALAEAYAVNGDHCALQPLMIFDTGPMSASVSRHRCGRLRQRD